MNKLSLITTQNLSILDQLQLEEALLRADDRNWCLMNIGTPPAIVMGISGKPEVMVDQDRLKQCPVPLIRRFSGGGTVFVDANTFFVTWICNAESVGTPCCPQKIHRWAADFYQSAFPALNMQLMENDYAIGERKFGGNAQYLCKGRWLHHSSLLWDYDPENMAYLLMPPKVPLYRYGRPHHDFLCRLREHLPEKAALQQTIVHQLKQHFHVESVSLADALQIKRRPHRQATYLLD